MGLWSYPIVLPLLAKCFPSKIIRLWEEYHPQDRPHLPHLLVRGSHLHLQKPQFSDQHRILKKKTSKFKEW